jgi:predicted permease
VLAQLTQDLGYALRSFRRSPAFTGVALLSLMLGIGATCAIFSVIYGVLIAPYPYAKPDEIWAPEVRGIDGHGGHGYAVDELKRLAALPAFADVMATSSEPVLLTGEFAPESFGGVLLSGNAFNFLGVPPVVGRTIQPTDIRPDGQAEPVVVLSYRLWIRLFDGSPTAIGRTLRLNDRPHTIIGVMPPRFGWYGNDGFWLPLAPARTDLPGINPIVRLAPGVSKTVAEQQLDVFNRQLARERPATFPKQGFTTRLWNYLDITVASGEMQTSLRLLLGAVGFLLLIACANVANLQLARGSARAREIAVRISIGAGRRRLLRQLLTESVVLSLAGGVLGVLFAFVAIRSIVALMPEFYVPNEARVTINIPVLLFSFAVSLLTGIVSGLAPALQSSKQDVGSALKSGRSTGAEAHGGRLRSALVVIEVALSVVLLAAAGLTARTFFVLQSMDGGIRADRVLAVGVPLPAAKYATLDQRNAFAQALMDRVHALPGVTAATLGLPFGGPLTPFTIAGETTDPSKRIVINLAGADHLRVFGIPLLSGRMFDASEVRRGDRVAVINEAAAKLWSAGPNRRARPSHRARAPTGADGRRYGPASGSHRRRRDRQYAERRSAGRSRAGARDAVLDYRGRATHARGPRQRRSQPAAQSDSCAGARHGRGTAARASVYARRGPRGGGRAAALHDGAVHGVRGAGPRAGGSGHLQRAVVSRDAAHARAGDPPRARRAARSRARPAPRDGRAARPRRARDRHSGESRRHHPAAQPTLRCAAGRSARIRRDQRGARFRSPDRLLHSRAARGQRRSDGGAPPGLMSRPCRPLPPPSGDSPISPLRSILVFSAAASVGGLGTLPFWGVV